MVISPVPSHPKVFKFQQCSFGQRKIKKTKQLRVSFQSKWFKNGAWLHYGDDDLAICHWCMVTYRDACCQGQILMKHSSLVS